MNQQISELLARRENYQHKVRTLIERYRYVVFYGCGAIYCSIVDTWNEYIGKQVDFCCDSDPQKWGKDFCGARCLSPDELLKIKDDCVLFVTIGVFGPIFDYLKTAGFPSVNLIYKYDLVTSAFLDGQDNAMVIRQLETVRALLADEKSRQVLDTILLRAFGGSDDINLMPSICERNQYFVPGLVILTPEECYVDVGAYNGDTAGYFMNAVRGKFDRIHAFELDPANYEQLVKNVENSPARDRIKTYNVGAWDEACDILFSQGKSQSTVGQGEKHACVVPLDTVLSDQRVTFIKMDIEGAELHALRGAQETIKRQRPKLAICVYHHISHLWEVPLYIHQLLPDHKLYFRHHTNLEYETVCYAIPPELAPGQASAT